ncbi:MAG TPA: hypothetical protein VEQ11_07095 [Chloroflexota bacterium]|nr:hypothetical protein [Chloroflexota bacterium]
MPKVGRGIGWMAVVQLVRQLAKGLDRRRALGAVVIPRSMSESGCAVCWAHEPPQSDGGHAFDSSETDGDQPG